MYIDLFAGCGGLSFGLYNAGLQGLFAVERNEDAFSTLKYNLIDNRKHFLWPDWLEQKNLDIHELLIHNKTQLMELEGQVDLVVGGPPCQGFSMAGERKGSDARNQLYNAYIEFVKLVKPRMLFFENVQGFTIGFKRKYRGEEKKGIPYSQKLIKELEKLGYDVDYKMIRMSEYGVPQNRKRFILFAIKNGNAKLFFERLEENIKPFLEKKNLQKDVCVKDAIGDLERRHGEIKSVENSRFMVGCYGPIESSYQRSMRANLEKNALPDSHRFANSKRETVALFQTLMEASSQQIRITPKMGLVDGLRKRGVTPLKDRCICPTITSIPDDFIHYSEPRILTVRENARIQGFSDDYIFLGKYTTGGLRRRVDVPRYTQVANAIPPLFAEQVGQVLRGM